MDDIQLILYIVFIAIAILSRVFKAGNKGEVPPRTTSNDESDRTERTPSFEELLREFTGEKQVQEPTQEVTTSARQPALRPDDEVKAVYESSIRQAGDYKTIDDLVNLEEDRHMGSFKHYDGYSEDEKEEDPNEYSSLLHHPEGAKQAVILAEILSRKY